MLEKKYYISFYRLLSLAQKYDFIKDYDIEGHFNDYYNPCQDCAIPYRVLTDEEVAEYVEEGELFFKAFNMVLIEHYALKPNMAVWIEVDY